MKLRSALLIILAMLLCGCTDAPEPTTVPTTQAPTEPTETQAVWVPYDGNSKHYTYLYTEGRNRDWEEDILYFGDVYLDEYPVLTHFPSRIDYGIEIEYSDEFYNPQMRQTFLTGINDLIQNVPALSDMEILYEMQRMLALLQDGHTCLWIDGEKGFPIGFQEFYENGEYVFYVTLLPEEHVSLIMSKLTGINDIPLDGVISRLTPYISTENIYNLLDNLSGGSSLGNLSNLEILQIAGIAEGDSVVYNLETEYGLPIRLKLESQSYAEMVGFNFVGHTHMGAYPEIYGENNPAFFYKWMENNTMMYVRINEFDYMDDYTFLQFGNDIIRELREQGGARKLVVDLRRNPGGYQFYGYDEFINALKRMEFDSLYVLIDQGSFSCAVITAGEIKKAFPAAVLVGTPAGQPANFFAGMNLVDYALPNSKVLCPMPLNYYRVLPENHDDALMPDILVYPTISDYKQCIDTILEAVKAQ